MQMGNQSSALFSAAGRCANNARPRVEAPRRFKSGGLVPKTRALKRADRPGPSKARTGGRINDRLRQMWEAGLTTEHDRSYEHDEDLERSVKMATEVLPQYLLVKYQANPKAEEGADWFRELSQVVKDAVRASTAPAVQRYSETGVKMSPYGQYFVHAGGGIARLLDAHAKGGMHCPCGNTHFPSI